MNTQDETAEDSVAASAWYGFDRLRLADDVAVVDVTVGSDDRWDRAHLRRLRQSADLPGLVPVIDADVSSDGKPFAVTPAVNAPTLGDRIPAGSDWSDVAGVAEAAARATHEAHLRGLFHGALSPDQIFVVDDDVAVSGIGLGLGGSPRVEYSHWVAPEVRNGGDATERSDVYSLGKILEASLGDALEDVPRSVRRLIMWSGSDTPEARPPSALEFASILAEALGENRRTYGPAFIPTAEANDLGSTASGAVAGHTRSEVTGDSSLGLGAAGLGVAGVAGVGVAAGAASALTDDVDDLGPDAGLELDDVDADADLDLENADFVAAGVDLEQESPIVDELTEAEAADLVDDASVTRQITQEVDAQDVEEASNFDSTQYSQAARDVELDDEYEVPAAAQTVDLDRTYQPQKSSNRAGLLLGAILAAGLAVIAWNLLSGSDDTPDVASAVVEQATDQADENNGEDVASASTVTTDQATTTSEQATTTSEQATTTTEAEPEVEAAPQATFVEGPLSTDEAGFQLVHGVPGVPVDLYVDGEALVPGFTPGAIAGPANLTAGTHQVDLYAAAETAAAAAADRTDSPVVSGSISVGSKPSTIVAHYDADGNPMLSAFVENFDLVDPGKGRLVVRHLAGASAVNLAIDGETVAGGTVQPGSTFTTSLAAGSHTLVASDGDGNVVQEAVINLGDGEMASMTIIGTGDTIDSVIQRYTGLATAPVDVPTGTGGLLDMDDDQTGLIMLGLLAAFMAAGGGVLLNRRSQVL